ncbi:MAG: exodeoxyribonuclease VII small subunit [Anaerolineae bacterium]|jgi:exodeoxyribonuclease VII small subunit|nr:exodeoxyribonuclease VII small subunit [Anaerolineae bacterium]MDH7474046.1 exodeoxyribonuclease VII small subunit [Anaerolineae bacterium]
MEQMQIEELSFEEAFKQLEETVHRLETGDLTLEESIALFERGQALARHCSAALDRAELRVNQLVSTEEGEYRQIVFTGEYEEKE